jgi:yecA family protein
LVTRHWNAMSYVLSSGEVFTPLLLEDKHGVSHSNDWAGGFMRGMELRREDWAPLVEDKITVARLCRFLRWRTNTIPILGCVSGEYKTTSCEVRFVEELE